jgi:hypothetical protein
MAKNTVGEAMANTGKHVSSALEIEEHAAKLAALMSIPAAVKPMFFFEVGDVAALLRVDPKTLQRKREARDKALRLKADAELAGAARGEQIDPLDIASIPYVPPAPTVKYAASELEDYLLRLLATSKSKPPANPGFSLPGTFRGFQSWLSTATPLDTLPFSIQADGRPLDLCLAIAAGLLTGAAERLTIREFGERLAHASAAGYASDEAEQLRGALDQAPVAK